MFSLKPYRVLEIGTAVSMPLCASVLANLGAEVIKIESRKKLDGNRVRVPRKDAPTHIDQIETFTLFHDLNGGKKSVTLNLKTPEGKALFLGLIRVSDVFIQNFAPGWLDRLGLSSATLAEANPRLIQVYASGYGQTGPMNGVRVYATIMSGIGGMEGLVGYPDGDVTGLSATAFGDPNSGQFGVLGVLSALYARERTGRGCLIDLSQIESIVTVLGEAVIDLQVTGRVPGPTGNESKWVAPHGIYRCAGSDRWVALSVPDQSEWQALCAVLREDGQAWADAPRFATPPERLAHARELDGLISGWTAGQADGALAERLQARGIRCTPVLPIEEVETDPHMQARGFMQQAVHPVLGSMPITSTPWKHDGTQPPIRGAGPMIGSANKEVYCGLLGLSEEQLADYAAREVLA